MKSFTNWQGAITDIKVEGIEHLEPQQLKEVITRGNKIKLLAMAESEGNNWNLSVKPVEVEAASFLGSCNGWEMGIEIHSDLYESIAMKNYEADPVGTSAAVLRDAIELCGKRSR